VNLVIVSAEELVFNQLTGSFTIPPQKRTPHMKSVQLNTSKLLGYRIAFQGTKMGLKLQGKLGGKLGGKAGAKQGNKK
jgi:hypothetical protein